MIGKLCTLLSLLILVSCTKEISDEIVETPKSGAKEILSFQFTKQSNSKLKEDFNATINEEAKVIEISVSFGVDVSEIVPDITISEGASISPSSESAQNFEKPIQYIITAENGSKATYTVNTNIAKASERDVLIAIYKENSNNKLTWFVEDEDVTGWEGVTIENGKVVGLDLSAKGIETITPLIENLFSLQTLKLSENTIVKIPDELGNLSTLKILDVSKNKLSLISDAIGGLVNLEELNLSENDLTVLPPKINNFTKLKILSISNNTALSTIPKFESSLISLEELNASAIGTSGILTYLMELPNLLILDVSNNGIDEITDRIKEISTLTTLNLSGNNIRKIPLSFFDLTKIQDLDLGANVIESIAMEIVNLQNLEYLDLSDNNFEYLPSSIAELISLKILDITKNKDLLVIYRNICFMPNSYGTELKKESFVDCYTKEKMALHSFNKANPNNNLDWDFSGSTKDFYGVVENDDKKITALYFYEDAEVSVLSKELEELQDLVEINFSSEVSYIAEEIGNLKNLEKLIIGQVDFWSDSKITIPDSFNKLEKLKELSLLGLLDVIKFPDDLSGMKSLETLQFREFRMKIESELPKGIFTIPNLKYLNMRDSEPMIFPNELEEAKSLQEIYIFDDYAESLSFPPTIGNLTNLKKISIYSGGLKELPKEIGNLTGLENLSFSNTSVTTIPKEICALEATGTVISKPTDAVCEE